MDDFFSNLPLFMELAKQKSYSRSAGALGLGVSTLSRRIKNLEEELSTTLFIRNTRNVALTESGQEFFQRCERIVAEAQIAREELRQGKIKASGIVRVAMFSELYHSFLAEPLVRFAKEWPGIRLHISLSDRAVDLTTEPHDMDIRVGPLPDSTLKAKKIATLALAVYASPSLLTARALPETPQDLRHLPCITLSHQGNPWHLTKGKRNEKVFVSPAHTANSVSVLRKFALAGLGATMLLPHDAYPHERAGQLTRLLPDWRGTPFDVHILWASSQIPLRVRTVMDFINDFFTGVQ